MRWRLYRWMIRLVWRAFLSRRLSGSYTPRMEPRNTDGPGLTEEVFWFHGASAGELESLLAVVNQLVAELDAKSDPTRIVLTAFSPSAEKTLSGFERESDRFAFVGLSPPEGQWSDAFSRYRPIRFVTARYEAWPDLWVSLSQVRAELVMVEAVARSSLRWAKRILGWLGEPLPRLLMLAARESEIQSLKSLFPRSTCTRLGDPRWDRVASRLKQPSQRASEVRSSLGAEPRAFLAQVWPSDFDSVIDLSAIGPKPFAVVPHSLDPSVLNEIEDRLRHAGRDSVRSSAGLDPLAAADCVLVDEIGVLAELYPLARWVYVGGGFESGIHSTLEPALSLKPIACGPKKIDRFPEVDKLSEIGMLTVVSTPEDFRAWVSGASVGEDPRWRGWLEGQLGASSRIVELLLSRGNRRAFSFPGSPS